VWIVVDFVDLLASEQADDAEEVDDGVNGRKRSVGMRLKEVGAKKRRRGGGRRRVTTDDDRCDQS
jgi:hypothetical protein